MHLRLILSRGFRGVCCQAAKARCFFFLFDDDDNFFLSFAFRCTAGVTHSLTSLILLRTLHNGAPPSSHFLPTAVGSWRGPSLKYLRFARKIDWNNFSHTDSFGSVPLRFAFLQKIYDALSRWNKLSLLFFSDDEFSWEFFLTHFVPLDFRTTHLIFLFDFFLFPFLSDITFETLIGENPPPGHLRTFSGEFR